MCHLNQLGVSLLLLSELLLVGLQLLELPANVLKLFLQTLSIAASALLGCLCIGGLCPMRLQPCPEASTREEGLLIPAMFSCAAASSTLRAFCTRLVNLPYFCSQFNLGKQAQRASCDSKQQLDLW